METCLKIVVLLLLFALLGDQQSAEGNVIFMKTETEPPTSTIELSMLLKTPKKCAFVDHRGNCRESRVYART